MVSPRASENEDTSPSESPRKKLHGLGNGPVTIYDPHIERRLKKREEEAQRLFTIAARFLGVERRHGNYVALEKRTINGFEVDVLIIPQVFPIFPKSSYGTELNLL